MRKVLLAVSLLVGGAALAQQDLQEQIHQLKMEVEQLRMGTLTSSRVLMLKRRKVQI